MIGKSLKFIATSIVLLPISAFGNPTVLEMAIGQSDRDFVESKYEVVYQAAITNVRKTVYELPVDQVDPDSLYAGNKLIEIALCFNDNSILSDIHLVYETWDFSQAVSTLDARFNINAEEYPAYGLRSVLYSWPDYSVVCFTALDSGFTHVIFASDVGE